VVVIMKLRSGPGSGAMSVNTERTCEARRHHHDSGIAG
jgi:hypothetical protein